MKSKEQTMQDEAKRFVEYAIGGLLPVVAYANKARDVFERNPCVLTGSRRHDAEEAMKKSVIDTRKLLWKMWKEEFKSYISAKKYCHMMEDALNLLNPEGNSTNQTK